MEEKIFGINPVLEALKAVPERMQQVLLPFGELNGKRALIERLARQQGVKVQRIPFERFDALLPHEVHQGVAAEVSPYAYQSLDDLVERWRKSGEPALLVILDSIEDPQNFGAIVRTAHTAGAHGIIIPKHRAAPISGVVAKAAAGALAHLPICRVNNLVAAIEDLRKAGIWIVGTAEDASQSLYGFDFSLDLALVIGSEGKGMHSLVRKHCDFMLSIPARGAIGSLNASAAAAVVLYEAIRQRHHGDTLPST
jgi:23S rRNA (guanosine2251-2'-O)-methyltransferase